MRIYELLWPRDRIDHIARHAVTPDEVRTRFILFSDKPMQVGICCRLSFSFRMARDIQ